MSTKSSIALITGAIAFMAFWGVALSSIEGDSVAVDPDGYGIYQARNL